MEGQYEGDVFEILSEPGHRYPVGAVQWQLDLL